MADDSFYVINPPVTPIAQRIRTSCWLACYQMLYLWNKKDPDDVARILSSGSTGGRCFDVDQLKSTGLDRDLFPEVGAALKISGLRSELLTKDIPSLVHYLKFFGPMWVAGNWKTISRGGNHVIVVVGADNRSHDTVKIINPWDETNPDLVYAGDVAYNDEFKNGISQTRFSVQIN